MNDETTLSDQALARLQGFLQAAELDAQVAVLPGEDAESIILAITGTDARLLVGPHGQYLDAFQHLFLLMMRHTRDLRPRLTVDADGYRAKRTQTLIKFAQQLAEQVLATGQEAVTDPLNPLERRIFHTALVDHPDVTTYSEGMEPERYVVVTARIDQG